jgi:glutamine synthetase type III
VIKENKQIIFNGNGYSKEAGEGSGQARASESEEHR